MKRRPAVVMNLLLRPGLLAVGIFVASTLGFTQEPLAPFQVRFHEARTETTEVFLPVDPQVRITTPYTGNMCIGIHVDGKLLCCGDGAIRTAFKVDNQIMQPTDSGTKPLPKGPTGTGRNGFEANWAFNNLHFTQIVEVIPSRPQATGQKRRLDTALIRYVVENKSNQPRQVGVRVRIDTLCVDNDGALFASPTTHPGKVLNGIEFKGKELPDYVQILQKPDVKDPGFVGTWTLKMGDKGPNRMALTSHGAGENGWEVNVMAANGDSDAVLYWDPQSIPPGGKREYAYAYGGGGLATSPGQEGRLNLKLGGSFEPGKTFTVAAVVEDPTAGQSLLLELPKGMERLEGKEWQAVPRPNENHGASVVLWKARVLQPGEYALKVRSSNGVTETRTVTITPAQ